MNNSSKTWRVVVVDDHPLVRRALRQIIEAEEDMLVCGEADDRSEGLAVVTGSLPHLVIIDLSLKTSTDSSL